MAVFSIRFRIGDLDYSEQREIDGLVDTDRMFATLSSGLLRDLGIDQQDSDAFETSPGQFEKRGIGFARVSIGDRTGIANVIFGPDDSQALLGKHTLASLLLEADEENRQVVRIRHIRMCQHPRLVSDGRHSAGQ